ncbi:MAG TPA: ABC transporter permease [bacterium]|nr:ABC transporter permease [bacterium]
MRYEWFVAKRYLRPQGGATFIFHLTLISTAGVALGVASLITVLSVMNGFGNYLRSKILQVRSHIVFYYDNYGGIGNYDQVLSEFAKIPNVAACSPTIKEWGFLYPVESRIPYAVNFVGIDPDYEIQVTALDQFMIAGSLDGLREERRPPASGRKVKITELAQAKKHGILIGKELAAAMFHIGEAEGETKEQAYSRALGRRINLITLRHDTDTISLEQTSTDQFVVEGVFESGHYEYDSTLVYISLPAAQTLLGLGNRVTEIQFRLRDHSIPQTNLTGLEIFKKNQELLGGAGYGQTWMSMNQTFFQALDIEKRTMDYILKIIILVATFNIIATLFMVVTEKTRDIGLLRAIGAGRKNIMLIFIFLGLIVGALGAGLGVLGGFSICTFLQMFPPELPGEGRVYYLKYLPCEMELMDFVWVSVYTLVVSFLASIYPAVRAARFTPVDALRFS